MNKRKALYDQTVINGLKSTKIIVALHGALFKGPGHFLKDFLVENSIKKLIFISHPLLYVKEAFHDSSFVEIYERGHKKTKKAFHWILPEPVAYVKDVIYAIVWIISSRGTYDAFIGLDPLNALTGLFLKRIGIVRKVVYYSIDYFPVRFQNKIMNSIYHGIDRFCVYYCDETWNVGSKMAEARERNNHMDRAIYNRQYIVPIGVWFYKSIRNSSRKVQKQKLIYTGILHAVMGVSLAIRSLPKLVQKYPKIHLDIIGGGEGLTELQTLARDLEVSKYITFHGWVKDRKRLEYLLADATLGLAPFNTVLLANDDKIKNADPSKIKDYLLTGLPVIVTRAVSTALQLRKARCALVIDYTEKDFIRSVTQFFENKKLLNEYQENALRYIEPYDYGTIFCKNIKRLLQIQ